MHCPYCRHPDSRVVDSRVADDGSSIRRRRQCSSCGRRFSTLETTSVNVIKRSGATEPFKRVKIISGVRKACQGRPVSEDDLALLAQEVEESIRARGLAEIDANDVGLAILDPLQRLDEVAYLRFASVYQAFDGLEDFEKAIENLRTGSDPATAAFEVKNDPESETAESSGVPEAAGPEPHSKSRDKKSGSAQAKRKAKKASTAVPESEDPDQPTLI
ncbi:MULTISPECIES: transcriptional regulator NrdR [Micrococcaceae]|uniref:transcriptional regulator NrdR n=1 Tax=unclassified Kocuria TaxID=2649579 RepID=UPI0010129294